MGVSTLHHHFRELTAMSPVQYQKQLRLQAARGRMLVDGLDAASAAFEVGYESASQFNREYSRFFGQPPDARYSDASLAGRSAVGNLRGRRIEMRQSATTSHDNLLSVMADRLFIFDMDGTLLVKTTASIEIAKITGTVDRLHVLEKSFADGVIDAFRFAQEVSASWGILSTRSCASVLETTPSWRGLPRLRHSSGEPAGNRVSSRCLPISMRTTFTNTGSISSKHRASQSH